MEQQIGFSMPQPEWMTVGIYVRAAQMGTPEYPMRTLEPNLPYHFAPRIGVAYQITPKTVIRSSYGLIWGTKTGSYFLDPARWNVGYGDAAHLLENGTNNGGLTYLYTFSNPMPGNAGYVPYTHNDTALNNALIGTIVARRDGGDYSRPHVNTPAKSPSSTRWAPVEICGLRKLATTRRIGAQAARLPRRRVACAPGCLRQDRIPRKQPATPVPNPFSDIVGPGTFLSTSIARARQTHEVMPLWARINTYGDPIT